MWSCHALQCPCLPPSLREPASLCALQFQDNTYLPDGYAPMGFNNVRWYNLGPRSAENHHRPYVPMYAPLAPPPPYYNLYHLDMQWYGPNPPLQYHKMGPGYYYPGQEGPYQGYYDPAPYHPHLQPLPPGSVQTGRSVESEQKCSEGSSK